MPCALPSSSRKLLGFRSPPKASVRSRTHLRGGHEGVSLWYTPTRRRAVFKQPVRLGSSGPLPDRCIQAKWHCRFDYAWMFGAGQIRIVDAAEAMGLDLGTAELLQDPPMLTAAEVTEFVSTAPC